MLCGHLFNLIIHDCDRTEEQYEFEAISSNLVLMI